MVRPCPCRVREAKVKHLEAHPLRFRAPHFYIFKFSLGQNFIGDFIFTLNFPPVFQIFWKIFKFLSKTYLILFLALKPWGFIKIWLQLELCLYTDLLTNKSIYGVTVWIVIGHNGDVIRRLQVETGCRMQITPRMSRPLQEQADFVFFSFFFTLEFFIFLWWAPRFSSTL